MFIPSGILIIEEIRVKYKSIFKQFQGCVSLTFDNFRNEDNYAINPR